MGELYAKIQTKKKTQIGAAGQFRSCLYSWAGKTVQELIKLITNENNLMDKIWYLVKTGDWMSGKKLILFVIPVFAFFLCLPSFVWAGATIPTDHQTMTVLQQDKIIKGKVTDASSGESLPGVNIVIDGTVIGTTTNVEGEFTLSVPNNDVTLVFSFIGFKAKNVKVGNSSIINVQLEQNTTELEETVVIGYQEVHKKRVTASVVSIPSEVISEIPAASISTLLSGKAAGVQNLTRSGAPGMAGGGLLIRGNTHVSSDLDLVNGLSSPLYVIDGIPMSLQDLAGYDVTNTDYLASLNPADIESIDILKDASAAAIYGSRGANGVIIIKTKKGRVGEPEFRINTYSGISVKPDLYKVYTGAADRRFKMALIEKYIPDYTEWGPMLKQGHVLCHWN